MTLEQDEQKTMRETLRQAVLAHPIYGKERRPRVELYTYLVTKVAEPDTFVPVPLRERLISSLLNQWYAFDALQLLIDDPLVTDIHAMADRTVYRKEGRLYESTEATFDSDSDLVKFIERKLEGTPYEYKLTRPLSDAMLPEGYRMNVIGGPSTGYSEIVDETHRIVPATVVTIRKPILAFSLEELHRIGVMDREILSFLLLMMDLGDSFLIAGGVGSAKTTLLNALTAFMAGYWNVIIEEMGEMAPLIDRWFVRLTDRLPNAQGMGGITMEDNMMNTLRMDADNVILGEMRWPKTVWLFIRLLMLTKRQVSTSFHTNTDVDRGVHHVLQRLVLEGTSGSLGLSGPYNTASLIADNLRVIVTMASVQGKPRITEIGYLVDFEEQAIRWCKVAEWNYEAERFVFHGVPENLVRRARVKKIDMPFEINTNPLELHKVWG
ncbi:MAG: ATPase, T2SS/T4P/T4SS family [Bacilli bacterium]